MELLPDALKGIPADVLALVPAEVALTFKALPVRIEDDHLVIAVASGKTTRVLRAIQFATERKVRSIVVGEEVLEAAIQHYYSERPAAEPGPDETTVDDETAVITRRRLRTTLMSKNPCA